MWFLMLLISHGLSAPNAYLMNIPIFIELIMVTVLALPFAKRRKYFWAYGFGFVAFMVGEYFLLTMLKIAFPDSLTVRILITLIMYVTSLGACFGFFDEKPIDVIMIWATIILVREATDILFYFFYALCGVDSRTGIMLFPKLNQQINGVMYDSIHWIFNIGLYFLFLRDNHDEKDNTYKKLLTIVCVATGVLTVVLKNLIIYYEVDDAKALANVARAIILFTVIFLLWLRGVLLKSNSDRIEKRTIHIMLQNEKKQYDTLSDNMKTINMMTHDLKHQIENFQDRMTQDEIKLLKDAVESYDSILKTGNDVIDTVIYEKTLFCKDKGIVLTCNADGEACNFMKQYHLYSLLNNALGNAIEAVLQLEDESKKKVGLTIAKEGDMLSIECYNYFDITKNNGEKTTKKENKHTHGFGIKSINYVAERYKGNVSITKDEDMFFLEVQIPLDSVPTVDVA